MKLKTLAVGLCTIALLAGCGEMCIRDRTYYVDLSKQLLDLKLKMLEDVKHAG